MSRVQEARLPQNAVLCSVPNRSVVLEHAAGGRSVAGEVSQADSGVSATPGDRSPRPIRLALTRAVTAEPSGLMRLIGPCFLLTCRA